MCPTLCVLLPWRFIAGSVSDNLEQRIVAFVETGKLYVSQTNHSNKSWYRTFLCVQKWKDTLMVSVLQELYHHQTSYLLKDSPKALWGNQMWPASIWSNVFLIGGSNIYGRYSISRSIIMDSLYKVPKKETGLTAPLASLEPGKLVINTFLNDANSSCIRLCRHRVL